VTFVSDVPVGTTQPRKGFHVWVVVDLVFHGRIIPQIKILFVEIINEEQSCSGWGVVEQCVASGYPRKVTSLDTLSASTPSVCEAVPIIEPSAVTLRCRDLLVVSGVRSNPAELYSSDVGKMCVCLICFHAGMLSL
ncbi:hypothetical protein XENOCAPTIV_001891, partial [Xenoophorus captivus]